MTSNKIQPGTIITESDLLAALSNPSSPYTTLLKSIDAILLLGGGVPLSPTQPPLYVQRRCDVTARIMNDIPRIPAVICLSAGTAHVPQYITPHDGLPLWESTASAGYLLKHATFPIAEKRVFAETTSYDTISNAFFARTTMTDVAGWRRILVVTNEFHIGRSKAIFDWIFTAPTSQELDPTFSSISEPSYEMYYLSCDNVGLTKEAIDSRKAHEARGETNVRTKLSKEYDTLRGVWQFLTEKHDFYSANRLVKRAMGEDDGIGAGGSSNLLKASYGGGASTGGKGRSYGVGMMEYKDGRVVISLDSFSALFALFLVGFVVFVYARNTRIWHGSKIKESV